MARSRRRIEQPGTFEGPGPIDYDPIEPTLLYRLSFAALDRGLPLALLPVRLETRWYLDHDPPELRVRIFPDALHADGHTPALSEAEQQLGRAFWRRTWRAGGDVAGQDAAFAWLAGRLGPWRAAWVAGQLEPRNAAQAPAETVPEGVPLDPAPRFPTVDERAGGQPTWPRLLPERFAAMPYGGGAPFGVWWGNAIPADLALAPGPLDLGGDLDGRTWLEAQGLAWTFDFEEAERVGMGIRIDLGGIIELDEWGFEELIVVGVRTDDQREPLEELLRAHRYTHGLDFVPQGTPTNSTETAASGLCLDAPSLPAVREAELEAADAGERPEIAVEGGLYRLGAADAVSVALGLGRDNALDRATNAGLPELRWAEAMNQALWPAVGGFYFDHVLDGVLSGEAREWLRDWSVRYVRGSGPLPSLLVGSQPYGLLPVSLVELSDGSPASNVAQVEDVIVQQRLHGDVSLPSVAHLDPDATDAVADTSAEGELAAVVSRILGAVPHPTSLRLARSDPNRSTYNWEFIRRKLVLASDCASVPGYPVMEGPLWTAWETLSAALDAATMASEQHGAVESFVDSVSFLIGSVGSTTEQDVHYERVRDETQVALCDFLEAHRDRTSPMLWLPGVTTLMGDLGDPNAFTILRPTDAPWELPLVAAGRTDADLEELRDWLRGLADDVDAQTGTSYDYAETLPLLRQLLRWSVEQATDAGDRSVLGAGLGGGGGVALRLQTGPIIDPLPPARLPGLIEVAESAGDPVGELERLLRESLGAWAYRLDAWYTAVAAWRLENKRQARPRGIQIGAYGVLVDVKPRARRGASDGYVLAPSLAHATTAAILRSGWAGLGGSAESAGLAVDLSSDRIRRAHWVVDGVRQGQDLGLLLGARFERRLHDAGLDVWIDELRQLALDAKNDPAPPNAIVDGLLLARARSGASDLTEEEQAAATAVTSLLAGAAKDRLGLEAALDSLHADLDAAADAAVAQSVFSLTQGNIPEATAALTASATGEVDFPHLRFADTPRLAQTITHRLLLLADPGAASGWPGAGGSGRALAAPALDAWLAGLLGDPKALRFSVRFDDPETGKIVAGPFPATVADVGLSPLDLVYLAPAGEQTGLGMLGDLLAAWGDGLRPEAVPSTAVAVLTTEGDPSLEEVALVCRSLRRLVAQARDLDGRDLVGSGATDVPAGLDTAELEARVVAMRGALDTERDRLAGALRTGEGVREAMLALAGFQLSSGLPRTTDPDALVAQGQALLREIDSRLAALYTRAASEKPGWVDLDDLGRYRALRDRMHLLVGHALPLCPRFTATNGADLDASFDRQRLGSREEATGWLAAAGRVDPGARRLRVAVDLAEAARDAVLFDFSLGQLPDHEEEGWAALEPTAADERGRLCLLATGPRPRFEDEAVAGLVLGTWTETLPRTRQTAGLAVHFDAPAARAPQSILLCVAEDGRGFDFELVRDLVKQTVDLARLRMVGPETLLSLGQYLPAGAVHVDTNPGGEA